MKKPKLFFIGGTGIDAEKFVNSSDFSGSFFVHTPYGEVLCYGGGVNGVDVVGLNRHGKGKQRFNPTNTPYRVNAAAFGAKGLDMLAGIGVTAVGSLWGQYLPGDFVLISGLKDDTKFRTNTFFDKQGSVAHLGGRRRYCPIVQDVLSLAVDLYNESANGKSDPVVLHTNMNLVVIEGPDFNDELESRIYRSFKDEDGQALLHLVGMTQQPEANLMRECGLHYSTIGVISDFDSWSHEPVDNTKVKAAISKHYLKLEGVLRMAYPLLKTIEFEGCDCETAIDNAMM